MLIKSSMPDMKPEDIAEAIRILETELPQDVERRILECLQEEEGISREALNAIAENVRLAKEMGIPMCQDTGSLIFFVKADSGCREICKAIREGVALATERVPLRANMVDPLSRRNTGNNLGRHSPAIHIEPADGAGAEVAILAKGAGSENVSAVAALDPDQSVDGIVGFIIETVRRAGAKPCPPIVLGVGVGGTIDVAAYLSKKALLRRIDDAAPDGQSRELECRILREVNALGIGPMGFGGKNTALAAKVEVAECHTASLPVAVNIQCWALRRVVMEIEGGRVEIRRY